jgi:hypothetical protein
MEVRELDDGRQTMDDGKVIVDGQISNPTQKKRLNKNAV